MHGLTPSPRRPHISVARLAPLLMTFACRCDRIKESATGSGPCDDGSYGWLVTDPEETIFVQMDGDDAATGEEGAPLGTIDAALTVAAESGKRTIALGPGEFPSAVTLADSSLSGLVVSGCAADKTTLVSPTPDEPDALWKLIDVESTEDGAPGLTLGGLSTSGGRRPIWVQGSSVVSLDQVIVDQPVRTGIFVYGAATLSLVDTTVSAPEVEDSSGASYGVGFGVSAQGASRGALAHISMEGGGLTDAQVAGLIGEYADIKLSDVEISGTMADAATGLFGRGIQVQGYSYLSLRDGCRIHDNQDAGVFSVASLSLDIEGGEISNNQAADLPDGGTSGDGIVAIRGDDTEDFYTVADFVVNIDGATVSGNDRAGVILEDVTYSLAGNSGGNGLSEGDYVVMGDATEGEGSTDAVIATDLDLNTEALGADTTD